MVKEVDEVTLQDIWQAKERIADSVKKTPLIPLNQGFKGTQSREVKKSLMTKYTLLIWENKVEKIDIDYSKLSFCLNCKITPKTRET